MYDVYNKYFLQKIFTLCTSYTNMARRTVSGRATRPYAGGDFCETLFTLCTSTRIYAFATVQGHRAVDIPLRSPGSQPGGGTIVPPPPLLPRALRL